MTPFIMTMPNYARVCVEMETLKILWPYIWGMENGGRELSIREFHIIA